MSIGPGRWPVANPGPSLGPTWALAFRPSQGRDNTTEDRPRMSLDNRDDNSDWLADSESVRGDTQIIDPGNE